MTRNKQTGVPQCLLLLVHWFYWEPEVPGELYLGCDRSTLYLHIQEQGKAGSRKALCSKDNHGHKGLK